VNGELPSFYRESNPKARKARCCCECRGFIQPGETYHIFSGMWDRFQAYKSCEECHGLRGDICATIKESEDFPCFTDLYQSVFESRHSTPELVTRFMDTRRKRNAPPSPRDWMEIAEREMLEGVES